LPALRLVAAAPSSAGPGVVSREFASRASRSRRAASLVPNQFCLQFFPTLPSAAFTRC
jgi:hypothetical protein